MKGNIFLIGFMGTGKSTVSKQLSNILKMVEVDTDLEIENREDKKISDIFSEFGEEYFRDLETALIKEFETKSGFIISCGGGTVLREENVRSMKQSGQIILLTATPETVYYRVRGGKNRPLLNGNMNVAYIKELMEKRAAFYQAAADKVVETDHKTPKEIAEEIVKK